ncbi:hypothetical protein GUU_04209, partial [Malacoplasma iowae 695]
MGKHATVLVHMDMVSKTKHKKVSQRGGISFSSHGYGIKTKLVKWHQAR